MGSRFDEAGWAVDPVHPLAAEAAYSLFTSDASARFDVRMMTPKAASLLGLAISVEPAKRFVHGAYPNADRAQIVLESSDFPRSVVLARVFPIERATELKARAVSVGSMGMETLVTRARRVIQLEAAPASGDPRAPLACAAIFAATFLAAVLPPDEPILFGTKGARERLENLGIGS
ncbi:MAG: hypothetical protein HOW73_07005 [Polyangiaceae bacterium]|nr:hypothetical protein [Polyangiaceae bacterium]